MSKNKTSKSAVTWHYELFNENDNNPRYITEQKFQNLVKSIQDFPEMLETRPIVVDETGLILGGNMRYKAAVEAGLVEIPVAVVMGWTQEQKDKFIIKDNVSAGAWDWDILANVWDNQVLAEWGMDVWQPEKYTPAYEPTATGSYTNESDIQSARDRLDLIGKSERQLKECMCPKCGHEFFINE